MYSGCCSVLPCVAVCCSVLQCVAVRYSVLQCDAVSVPQDASSQVHQVFWCVAVGNRWAHVCCRNYCESKVDHRPN